MPILHHRWEGRTPDGQPLPGMFGLQRFGPRVGVLVGVHSAIVKSFEVTEGGIPSPIKGDGLIDTGASITSVDLKVAEKLGLAWEERIVLGYMTMFQILKDRLVLDRRSCPVAGAATGRFVLAPDQHRHAFVQPGTVHRGDHPLRAVAGVSESGVHDHGWRQL